MTNLTIEESRVYAFWFLAESPEPLR